jgi:excisionase family DNA binding protein
VATGGSEQRRRLLTGLLLNDGWDLPRCAESSAVPGAPKCHDTARQEPSACRPGLVEGVWSASYRRTVPDFTPFTAADGDLSMSDDNKGSDEPDALLTPSEVAELFGVAPKTVTRWAGAGKLGAIRTLGGQRRFRVSEVRRRLDQLANEEPSAPNRHDPEP